MSRKCRILRQDDATLVVRDFLVMLHAGKAVGGHGRFDLGDKTESRIVLALEFCVDECVAHHLPEVFMADAVVADEDARTAEGRLRDACIKLAFGFWHQLHSKISPLGPTRMTRPDERVPRARFRILSRE